MASPGRRPPARCTRLADAGWKAALPRLPHTMMTPSISGEVAIPARLHTATAANGPTMASTAGRPRSASGSERELADRIRHLERHGDHAGLRQRQAEARDEHRQQRCVDVREGVVDEVRGRQRHHGSRHFPFSQRWPTSQVRDPREFAGRIRQQFRTVTRLPALRDLVSAPPIGRHSAPVRCRISLWDPGAGRAGSRAVRGVEPESRTHMVAILDSEVGCVTRRGAASAGELRANGRRSSPSRRGFCRASPCPRPGAA